MATKTLSLADANATKQAIEDALRKGYRRNPLKGEQGVFNIAADAMGLSRTTVASRVAGGVLERAGVFIDWSLENSNGGPEVAEIKSAQERKLKEAQDELKTLRRRNKELEETASIEKLILDIIGNMSDKTREAEPPGWLVKSSAKSKGQHVPLTIWSDWHIGETVFPDEIHDLNEFNSKVAEQRVRRLVETTIHLARNHGPGNYPGIVIMLGGDMVTGNLHDLPETNYASLQESVLQAFDLLAWGIQKMHEEFGRVFLPCVSGNHGRGSLKPPTKNIVQTNFDWLIYQMLERHFRGNKNIVFKNPTENEVHFRIFNRRYLAMHGDMMGVKGGDGIIGSLGPILRGLMKVGRQSAAYGVNFDTLLLGHWHQTFWLNGVIVNNCLKGFDEFAAKKLRAVFSPASQTLVYVNEHHGHVSFSEVFVQDQPDQSGTEWVQWLK